MNAALGFWLGVHAVLAQPVIDPIPDVTVPVGKMLLLPVTASSPGGWPLVYSVKSSDKDRIAADLIRNPQSLKITVQDFGEMTFALFDDSAPDTVGYIKGFAQSGFYNGLKFHRVVPRFVIQGGDPLGTGTGGPEFRYDDEFALNRIFGSTGQLAMANSGKESNGSQFFVTLGPQRFLDFNHTLVGQLVRGFDVLNKIGAVQTDANSAPLTPVIMSRLGLVPNHTDAVIFLLSVDRHTEPVTISVTVDDRHGGVVTNTFQARAVADPVNDPVVLYPVPDRVTPVNTPVTLDLPAFDMEFGPIIFEGFLAEQSAPHGTLSIAGDKATITPAKDYRGPLQVVLGAAQQGATSRGSTQNPFDVEVVTIGVGTSPILARPSIIPLEAGVPFTNRVVAAFATADTTTSPTNFIASMHWPDGRRGTGLVIGNPAEGYRVLAGHTLTNAGTFRVRVFISDYLGATAIVDSLAVIPPELKVDRTGAQTILTWPGWATDYVLESLSELKPGAEWKAVDLPRRLDGYDLRVSLPTDSAENYYRLRFNIPQ